MRKRKEGEKIKKSKKKKEKKKKSNKTKKSKCLNIFKNVTENWTKSNIFTE